MIAVRPGTPQAVYPERLLTGPQPPDGPRQWVCPLAVIDWAGRPTFSAPSFSVPARPVLSPPRAVPFSAPAPPFSRPVVVAPLSSPPHSEPSGPVVYDCRQHFYNLVTLSTRRPGACCTLTVLT